ncbi:MAG: hypothetical protein WHV66_14710 [Anaerolineales bacterium]
MSLDFEKSISRKDSEKSQDSLHRPKLSPERNLHQSNSEVVKPTSPASDAINRNRQMRSNASAQGGADSAIRFMRPVIDVPIDRNHELDQMIERYEQLLRQREKNITRLAIREAKHAINPPLDLLNQLDDEKEARVKEELALKAVSEEKRLHIRYEREIRLYASLRHCLGIRATNRNVSFANVMALCEKVWPQIFDKNSLLLSRLPGHLATKFRDAKDIDEEIEKLSELTFHENAELIRYRLEGLYAARQEFEKSVYQSDISISITQDNDPLPDFLTSRYRVTFADEDAEELIISIFKSPAAVEEHSQSAVALTEICEDILSRIAITLLKPRSSTEDVAPDLIKLKSRLCSYCRRESNKSLQKSSSNYHLPTCLVFLHYYDEAEQIEDLPQTDTLFYIPVCEALQRSLILRYKNEPGVVPIWVFGELFSRGLLGSCWFESDDVRKIYENLIHFIPRGCNPTIHVKKIRKQKEG